MSFSFRLLAPLVFILVSIIYYPGLGGGFAFDDYSTIVHNPFVMQAELKVESLLDAAYSGNVAGKLRRPIPMLSFAANAINSGTSALAYKLTNLLIHIINGLLVFVFARLIFERSLSTSFKDKTSVKPADLAFFVAVLWLIHPINLTAVLYVVQRMTSLAAAFSLLACISYCIGRNRMVRNAGGMVLVYLAVPAFILLGLLCKENVILVVPLLALIEACFYRFEVASETGRRLLISTYAVSAVLVFSCSVGFLLLEPNWLAERYEYRSFSLEERLFTEARVLWFYVSLIALPRLPEFALYHDDIALSTSLFAPISTAYASAALLACVIAGLYWFKKKPLVTFVIFWFLIGHLLESSVIPLDIAHEHRNYLPGLSIYFGVVMAFAVLGTRLEQTKLVRSLGLFVIVILSCLTGLRAAGWSDPATLAKVEAENHPESFRSVYAAGRLQYELYNLYGRESDYARALDYLENASRLTNDNALPLIAIVQLAYGHGDKPAVNTKVELERRLKYEVTQQPVTSALGAFVKCHAMNEHCAIPLQEIFEYYQSVLQNKQLRPAVKAKVLVDFALLNANEANDFQFALLMVNEAVELKPNISAYHLLRARLLIMAEEFSEAAEAIEIIQQRRFWEDRIRVRSDQIESLKRSLNRA